MEAAGRANDPLFVSVLVLGEIRRGIERLRRRDPLQAAGLERWLGEIRERFHERTIAVDRDIADAWGSMDPAARPPVVDGLMAATAKVHGLVLVTRNVTDVAQTGVRVLNPWDTPPA